MFTVAVVSEAKIFSCVHVLVLVFPVVWVSQRFLKWGLRLTLTFALIPFIKQEVWEVMLNSLCGWGGRSGMVLADGGIYHDLFGGRMSDISIFGIF